MDAIESVAKSSAVRGLHRRNVFALCPTANSSVTKNQKKKKKESKKSKIPFFTVSNVKSNRVVSVCRNYYLFDWN